MRRRSPRLLTLLPLALLAAPPARADVTLPRVGEVAIVEGNAETLAISGQGISVRIGAVARKVIAAFGDDFDAITLWLTFEELNSPEAGAYAVLVKSDVRGLGMPIRDSSAGFGSKGRLHTVVNMKQLWQLADRADANSWNFLLGAWAQEIGHRWMVYMKFLDRRTGLPSDALLGRSCSHYHRLVDAQASVHDGVAWEDRGGGTFVLKAMPRMRFSALDLYGMGLIPPEEVAPFFLIDDVPGYRRSRCGNYEREPPPPLVTVTGTRHDVSLDDIVAVEGPRVPAFGQLLDGRPQDYLREAQVVVTRPDEPASSEMVQKLAGRIDEIRADWERFAAEATGRRLVVCTKLSADCGDPRSDVSAVVINPERVAPQRGDTRVDVTVKNSGQATATGVQVGLDVKDVTGGVGPSAAPRPQTIATLAPGEARTLAFQLGLGGVACGGSLRLVASARSDQHHSRWSERVLVGTERAFHEGFEADSGWVIDPDGSDDGKGARWERGTPELNEIVAGLVVQIGGAHGGAGAFVTGAAAQAGPTETFVHAGRSTLESSVFDGTAWREPRLRYWAGFSGMEASPTGHPVASPRAALIVLARPEPDGAAGTDAGTTDGGWIEIDRLSNAITPLWSERIAALPPAVAGRRFKLRFVAEDSNPRAGGVEVALDDVELHSTLAGCQPPSAGPPATAASDGDGCGCRLGRASARATGMGGVPFALVMLALVSRSRRRPRQSSPSSSGPGDTPARSSAR